VTQLVPPSRKFANDRARRSDFSSGHFTHRLLTARASFFKSLIYENRSLSACFMLVVTMRYSMKNMGSIALCSLPHRVRLILRLTSRLSWLGQH
jgi:hypothetical protein